MFDKYFSIKDYNLYLSDCVVRTVPDKDGVCWPAHLKEVNTSDDQVRYVKYKAVQDFEDCTVSWDKKEDVLDFTPLTKGAINCASSVVYLKNLGNMCSVGHPWKYKKLPHSKDTQVFDPSAWERKALSSPRANNLFSPALMKAWVNNTYFTPSEAIKSVVSLDRLGSAWSADWYITLNYRSDSFRIWKREHIVGQYMPKVDEILLKPVAHPFAEELQEYGLTVRKIPS